MSAAEVAPAPVAVEDRPVAPVEAAPVECTPAHEEHAAAVPSGEEAHADGAVTPPHKKRLPFANLKNKLFHPKSPATESADPLKEAHAPAAAAVEETPKEAAVPAETAPVIVEEAPAAEEAAPAAPAAEEDKKDTAAVKEKKPKSPGVFDKVKSFFGEKDSKHKKAKTPSEEKGDPVHETAPATTEGESAAPAAEPSVTSPEAVAIAGASSSAAAPVPQVIEPIGAPIVEPTKEEAELAATAVKPEGVEEAKVEPAHEAAAAEEKRGEEIKFDETAKTDDKAPKRDLAKLARRLSGKVGGFLGSPKKEKKEKDVVPAVTAEEAPVASTSSEAPKIETPVDESKLGAAAPEASKVVEPVIAQPAKIEEPVKATEPAVTEPVKVEEVAAPVQTATEEPSKDVDVKKEDVADAPAPIAATAAATA